ncbi:hypothetical protein E2542_SST27230 [Spatholobus suberectus]|nr:hypothetical protein E2542_SST27230 [Spatholobus suberectus]
MGSFRSMTYTSKYRPIGYREGGAHEAKEEGKRRSWIIAIIVVTVTVTGVVALLAFSTYHFRCLKWKNGIL